jgi:BA14K-like protein
MISLKVLSAAAVVALALPAVAPSFAQTPYHRGPGAPAAGALRAFSTVPGAAAGGPTMQGGGPRTFNPGPNMAASPGPRMTGGPGVPGGGGPRYGRGDHDGDGDHHHHGGGGFFPGVIAGAVIGGAVASQGGYYGSGGYYGDGPYYAGTPYYGGQYDDGGTVVEAAPQSDDDAVAYCMQRYRSYDPGSGTFLGNDGLRHPCP